MSQALSAVVCGMPFSGTTFLSRLICAHPKIDSGFECGLLFGDSPAQFPESGRYYRWMMEQKPPYNWKLTQKELDDVCAAEDFSTAYERVVKHCHLFNEDTPYIIDKTPAYIFRLPAIMEKVPDVPFIVVTKEKLNQYYSFKKRDKTLEFFKDRYVKSNKAIRRAKRNPELKKRLLIIPFTDLVEFQGKSYRKIINFISRFNPDISFDPEQIKTLSNSIKSDMDNKKKLRKTYSFEEERDLMLKSLSEAEIAEVNSITI